MLRYIIKRLLQTLIVLFCVSLFAFFIVRLAPGDPARTVAGENASEEQVEQVRERLGFNKPLPEQYLIYIDAQTGREVSILRMVQDDEGYVTQ